MKRKIQINDAELEEESKEKCVMCGNIADYEAYETDEPLCNKHLLLNDDARDE